MTQPTQSIMLGWKPYRITPILSRGEDWIVTIEPKDSDGNPWPEGTTLNAVTYAANTDLDKPLSEWPVLFTWPGQIVNGNVILKGKAEEADQIPAKALMRIRVVFPGEDLDDTADDDRFLWAKGTVSRDD
ncbi:hypothetical protein PP713_14125 [Mycobacterium sp. CSUR Q5927]|nr:hypothetical protein [Mycobacterium sp. CSUR Q5927]